jgi:hypothetical protein
MSTKLAPTLLNNGNAAVAAEETPSVRSSSSSSCEKPVQDTLLSLPNNVNSNKNLRDKNSHTFTRIIVSRVNLNETEPKKTEHRVAKGFLEEMEILTNSIQADGHDHDDDDEQEDRPFEYAVKLQSTSTDCPWIGHYDDLAYVVRQEKGSSSSSSSSSSTILGVFSGVATFSKFENGCLYQLLDLDHCDYSTGEDQHHVTKKTVVKVNNNNHNQATKHHQSFHLDKLCIKIVPVADHPYWNGFPKRSSNLPVVGSSSRGFHDFKYHRAVNVFIANAPSTADGEERCADYVVECLYFRPSGI